MRRQGEARGVLWRLMIMGILAVSAAIASAVQAEDHAMPSWDQKLPVAKRFVVLTDWNNQAVLDRETGLVWEKSPDSFNLGWVDARFACALKNVGGRVGWRLPAFDELASLVDRSVASPSPTLPPGHPFTGDLSFLFWSATTDAGNPANAWVVRFNEGSVGTGTKGSPIHAWCVRGGMNADAY